VRNITKMLIFLALISIKMSYAQGLDLETLIAGIRYYDSLIETYAGEATKIDIAHDSKLPPGVIVDRRVVAFVARHGENFFIHCIDDGSTKGWTEICLGLGSKVTIIPRRRDTLYIKNDICLTAISSWCDPLSWYTAPWGYNRYVELPLWKYIKEKNLRIIKKEKIPIWDGYSDAIIWPGQKLRIASGTGGRKNRREIMCYVIGIGRKRDRYFKHAWIAPEIGFRVLRSESKTPVRNGYIGQVMLIHYKKHKYQGKTILFPDRVRVDVVYLTEEGKFDGYKYKATMDFSKIKVNVNVSKYFDLRNWIPVDAVVMDANSKQPIPAKEIFKWGSEKP